MNINIISPIGYTGYGIAGLNVVKGLHKLGHKVSLFLMGSPSIETQEDKSIIEQCLANAQYFDGTAPCIRIWHQHNLSQFVGKGKHIGFPFFELDRLNALEVHHVNYCDEVFVASEWAKEIVVRDLYNEFKYPDCAKHVHVVPLGVDRTHFNENPPLYKMQPPADKPFVFMNAGKFEVRKGHAVLVKVFNDTFTPADNVELWILPHNPFLSAQQTKEWESLYMKSPMGKAGKVKIFPRQPTSKDVSELMKQADCGIFPTSSEGWGLETLEMLSCGKPVIATNYSGQTEYLKEGKESVDLIPVEKMIAAFDGVWFMGQDGQWAQLNSAKIGELMRKRYEDRNNNQDKVKEDAIRVAKMFNWERTAKLIVDSI